MTTIPASLPLTSPENRACRTVLWGCLWCGVLDLAAALITSHQRGTPPTRVLHSISSSLLGRSAYEGGALTAALGLLMHFGIALALTVIFYALSRKFAVLVKHAIPAGLIYGALAYATMYWAVIPLSAMFRKLYLPNVTVRFLPLSIEALAIHLLCVGLPIALVVRHFSRSALAPDNAGRSDSKS